MSKRLVTVFMKSCSTVELEVAKVVAPICNHTSQGPPTTQSQGQECCDMLYIMYKLMFCYNHLACVSVGVSACVSFWNHTLRTILSFDSVCQSRDWTSAVR